MAKKSETFGIIESRFQPSANPKSVFNRLVKMGENFVYRETKFMTQIVYQGVETIYKSRDTKSFPANKLFIFKLVKNDAMRFLQQNPNWTVPDKYPVNQTNYDYDASYGVITGTDINSAYWVIAHKLGIISDNTYKKAQANDWKVIRLAALAVLGRSVAYQEFQNGIKQKNPIVIPSEDPRVNLLYRGIRYKCFEMMSAIAEILENDFEAYRTDCIYYRDTVDNRRKVYEYLDAEQFSYKQLEY
jgi:hypothetical protein